MKALLIAEKASLMRAVRAAVNANGFKDSIDFFSLHGHIMALKNPGEYNPEWVKWSIDTLPMIPEHFDYKVADEKLYQELIALLHNNHYDYLINCCDPDREGQHIFYSIYDTIGCHIPVKRMWHNDLSDTELMRALNHMEDDLNETRLVNLKIASKLRAQMDWLVGMNASRIVTLKRNSLTRLGRVMTPTFKILADRELLIRNFNSDTSYGIDCQYKEGFKAKMVETTDGKKIENANFFKKEEAQMIADQLPKEGTVLSVESKETKDNPPQLPSLADIQADANREFGFTLDKTLELVQSLYEKKLCSYPRTDCCYVTNEVAKTFPKILKAFAPTKSIGPFIYKITAKDIENVCKNKDYVNDGKVTAHYALIPTGLLTGGLSEDEKKIFEMICKRFTCIFLQPSRYKKTKVMIQSDNRLFMANGNIVLEKGYKELFGNEKKDEVLPDLIEGQKLIAEEYLVSEHTTKAPSRFNDASLLNAMINAANYVRDKELSDILKGDQKVKDSGGIGTPATRAAIVDKIVQPITDKNNKTYYLAYRRGRLFYVTDEGLDLMQSLKEFDISSPELTAIWEKKLKEIEEGLIDDQQFEQDMQDYIQQQTDQMLDTEYAKVIGSYIRCNCPLCGGRMKAMKNFYICEHYKKQENGCGFVIAKKMNGATLRPSHIIDLCQGKVTKALKMKSQKSGRSYYTGLVWNKENNRIDFIFENEHEMNYKCPVCKGKLVKKYDSMMGDYLSCPNNDFSIRYTISGKTLKEKEMKQLLEEGELKTTGFTGRNGKPFSSKLIIENGKVGFYFGKKKEDQNEKKAE